MKIELAKLFNGNRETASVVAEEKNSPIKASFVEIVRAYILDEAHSQSWTWEELGYMTLEENVIEGYQDELLAEEREDQVEVAKMAMVVHLKMYFNDEGFDVIKADEEGKFLLIDLDNPRHPEEPHKLPSGKGSTELSTTAEQPESTAEETKN